MEDVPTPVSVIAIKAIEGAIAASGSQLYFPIFDMGPGGLRFFLAVRETSGTWKNSPITGVCTSNPEHLYSIDYLIDSVSLPTKKPWQNKSVLHQKYVVEGVSLAQIAKEFLCSKNTIRGALIRAGIPLRKRQERRRSSNIDYGKRLVKGQRIEHLAEQKVIQAIVEMRKEGLSFQKIADFLSEIGVLTKKRRQRWHCEVVRNIYLRVQFI